MSELFTRVTDPRQARLCDFLVLPPTKRLNLSPKTLSSLGLPNGATCKSPNDTHIVKTLFNGGSTRVFFVSSASYTVISETDRLLNPSTKDLVPEIRNGTLFPIGRTSKGLEFSAWMDAYATLKEDFPAYPMAIDYALHQVGYNRSMTLYNRGRPALTNDRLATEVCDTLNAIGAPGSDATRHIPYRNNGDDSMAYMCLGSRVGIKSVSGYRSSHSMQFIRGSFLTELVKRGALLIRPSGTVLKAVTDQHLCWYANIVHQAFRDRIETVDMALNRLRAARKEDKAREAGWARVKRFAAKSSSKRMEAFTQALEGMVAEAQKGKKR